MDKLPMRVFLATMVVAGSFAVALIVVIPAYGEPETCPGICDRIPNTAWIDQHAVPLDAVYHWPALAGQAAHTTGAAPGPRFRFEELCGAPALPQDPRDSAVVARSTVAHPDGQWQLQAQVLHWRGDTA
ncbi:ATPase, partial [Mycobacterium avium 11-0986]